MYSSVLLSICITGQLATRAPFIPHPAKLKLFPFNTNAPFSLPQPLASTILLLFLRIWPLPSKWKFTQIRCWEKWTRTCKQGKGEKHLLPAPRQVLTAHPRIISLPKAMVLCWTSSLLWIEGPAFKVNGRDVNDFCRVLLSYWTANHFTPDPDILPWHSFLNAFIICSFGSPVNQLCQPAGPLINVLNQSLVHAHSIFVCPISNFWKLYLVTLLNQK